VNGRRFYVLSLAIVTILACALFKVYRQRLNHALIEVARRGDDPHIVESLLANC
jgi:hypothetical protein